MPYFEQPKGSAGAREHAALTAKLLAASLSGLEADGGRSSSQGAPSTEAARAAVARLAFQVR